MEWPQVPSKYGEMYHFPCDCGDWHYIEVMWDDEESDFRWLEICDVIQPHTIRERLKAVFTVLRGKPHYARSVILNDESVTALREILDKHAPKETSCD